MKFILTLILTSLYTCAFAQFNDTVNYHLHAGATGTINQTESSNAYVFDNNLGFSIKKKELALNSANDWIYGMQQNVQTNNDYTSTLDFDLYKTLPHFYYWGLGNYTTSYSLKINSQYQVGAGVAYNLIDKKTMMLNISDGILYEGSDIILPDTTRDVYNTYRNSFRLSFKWNVKDRISFHAMGYYQNSFSSGSDYIVRANAGLDIKLYKWLVFTTAFTYNRFNRTQKENTLFTYGLTIDRFF